MNANCSRGSALVLGLLTLLALFSFFAPVPSAPAPPSPGGTLTGRFVLAGKAPARKPLVEKGNNKVRDAACCARADIPDESLVVDEKTGGIANICVFLPDVKRALPTAKMPADVTAEVRGCRLRPHIHLVPEDGKVKVKNADPCAHALKVDSAGAGLSILKLVPAGRTGSFAVGKKSGLPFLVVSCPIHPWMKGYWVVVDNPYAAITDAQGRFTIKHLPRGEHIMRVWQERSGWLERGRKVKLEARRTTDLGVLRVPLARFEE